MKKLLLLLFAVVAGAMTAVADDYTELLTNGACDGTFDGWEKSDGGDGWAVFTEEDGTHKWQSSHYMCKLWQTVSLTDKGFSAATIDGGTMLCRVAAQVQPGWPKDGRGARWNNIIIYFLNESGSEIGNRVLVNNELNYAEGWQDYLMTFNVPANTRKMKYYIAAYDAVSWAGQYGPSYRNLSLKVKTTPDEPAEMELLTYIQSTGLQAFNTGYIHKANTKVVMDCDVKQNDHRNWETLFGARKGSYDNNAIEFFARTDGQNIPSFCRSGNEPRGTGFVYDERITIVAYDKTATWYKASDLETPVGSVTTTGTADDGVNAMFLFDLNTSGSENGFQEDNSKSLMKLYGCKIYEGDVLVRDYLPARKGEIVGLYDIVTGTFAGAMKNVLFIAGDVVESTTYPITIQSAAGGQVVADKSEAREYDQVCLTVTANDGYQLKSIEVKDAGGISVACNLISMEGNTLKYSFAMPASSVTVTAAFEPVTVPDPLPYIRSTGEQAFNTGYIHKANTKVVMDCEVKQNADRNWEALFGGRLGSYYNNCFVFFSRTDGKNIPSFSRSGNEPRGTGFVYGERITLVAYDKTATWYRATDPGTPAGSVTTSGTADDGKTPMFLFDLNTSSTEGGLQEDNSKSNMKLYGFKIYEDENLLHDFVPAQKDGVVGLYDKVTCSFAGSMTDTPFIAGSDTDDPAYPITLVYGDEGQVETNVNEARESTPVEVSIYPNDGYLFKSIEVKDADGNTVATTRTNKDGSNYTYSFLMPAKSVNVTVTFREYINIDIIRSIPNGCELKEFSRNTTSIYSSNGSYYLDKTSGSFTLAFEPTGNKVYIEYPFWYLDEVDSHWVEGTYNKTTGIISVPTGQGLYWNSGEQCGLRLYWGTTTVTDEDGSYHLHYEWDESVKSIQFKLDGDNLYLLNAVSHANQAFPNNGVSTGIMAIWSDDDTMGCNEFPNIDSNGQNTPYGFVPRPLVPAAPVNVSWYDCGDESGYTRLGFSLPDKSVGGASLAPEYVSYSVYLDNGNGPELFTFDKNTYNTQLDNDITEVPYSLYSASLDFYTSACYFYRTNAEGHEPLFTKNIGVQAHYTVEGVRRSSSITWALDVEDPDGISEIGQQTTDDPIYNLAGQRIQKVQKGINIVDGKKVLK